MFAMVNTCLIGLSAHIDNSSESYEEAGLRMIKALHKIVKKHPGETVLVINHTGNMRSLILTKRISTSAKAFLKAQKGDLDFGEIMILRSSGRGLTLEE